MFRATLLWILVLLLFAVPAVLAQSDDVPPVLFELEGPWLLIGGVAFAVYNIVKGARYVIDHPRLPGNFSAETRKFVLFGLSYTLAFAFLWLSPAANENWAGTPLAESYLLAVVVNAFFASTGAEGVNRLMKWQKPVS